MDTAVAWGAILTGIVSLITVGRFFVSVIKWLKKISDRLEWIELDHNTIQQQVLPAIREVREDVKEIREKVGLSRYSDRNGGAD